MVDKTCFAFREVASESVVHLLDIQYRADLEYFAAPFVHGVGVGGGQYVV